MAEGLWKNPLTPCRNVLLNTSTSSEKFRRLVDIPVLLKGKPTTSSGRSMPSTKYLEGDDEHSTAS
jgi:hypothetical protein